jgi:hypothetical protein
VPVVGVERRSQLGEAEVEDLDPAVSGQEEVLRLEVAVDDPLVMGGRETARDLGRVVEGSCRGEGTPPQPPPQGLAFEQLEDDEWCPVVLASVEDHEDVGMVQCARGLRLLREAPLTIGITQPVLVQDLDGDLAGEAGIAGAVDLAHPSRTERREDLVGPDAGSLRQRHGERSERV